MQIGESAAERQAISKFTVKPIRIDIIFHQRSVERGLQTKTLDRSGEFEGQSSALRALRHLGHSMFDRSPSFGCGHAFLGSSGNIVARELRMIQQIGMPSQSTSRSETSMNRTETHLTKFGRTAPALRPVLRSKT